MAKNRSLTSHFQGYTSPNYTPVPDTLFDEQLPDLTGAELKVLLYVCRRTFGFKRDDDNISLSQMLTGLRTRDGRVLDRGTGLTKKTLLGAINSLEEKNILITERRSSVEKGDEPTRYRLNVRRDGAAHSPDEPEKTTPPVGEKVHQGGGGVIPPGPWGKNSPTQETEGKTDSKNFELRRTTPNVDNFGPVGERVVPVATRQPGGIRAIGDVLPTSRLGETVAAWQHRSDQEAGKTASSARDGQVRDEDASSRQRTARRRERPRRLVYDEDREVLLAFIQDFSREFNDRAPLSASVTRAYNLLRSSGLSREAFVDRLYQARAITKERSASIRSQAGKDGIGLPTKNKMAYFFAVLDDLLDPSDDRGSPSLLN